MPTTKERTSCWHNVSAEPAVLVYSFVIFLYAAGMPNLIQQKVCSPETPPQVDYVCNDTVLVAQATDIVTVRAILKQSLPAIILLLAGSWRDSTNLNKPIIYFALFWEVVGICIEVFAYLNWTSSPWTTSITEGVINGLGGGSSLFFVGATCAITDNTRVEDRTARLTLVFAEVSFGACLAYAEANIYQYYLQQTFGYTIEDAGLYIAYRLLVGSLGSVLVPPLFIKLLKWSDFKIGVTCCLVTAISCVSMVFAVTSFEIKIFALLDIMKVFLFGLPKSIISKCVNEDEMGMFFSFCLIGESILPIIIFFLYDVIYTATSVALPGAFNLTSAAILTVLIIFYSISGCIYTPHEVYDNETKIGPEDFKVCEPVTQLPETSNHDL